MQPEGVRKRKFAVLALSHAADLSSLSAPRITILSASSGNGRCKAFASSQGPRSYPTGHPAANPDNRPSTHGKGYCGREGVTDEDSLTPFTANIW
jgi:hypothetical protein